MISKELEDILRYSSQEAARTGSVEVTPDHLILGILRHSECKACRLLDRMGIDRADFKDYLDCVLSTGRPVPDELLYRIRPSRAAMNSIDLAMMDSRKFGSNQLNSEHLLASVSRSPGCASLTYLKAKGAGRERIVELLSAGEEKKISVSLAKDITNALEAEIRRHLSKGSSTPS